MKTAEHIAARIGAPASTVEGWIKRPGGPSGKWVLKLIAAYGPGLLCRLFGAHAPVWLSHADMIERLNDFEAQAALLRADVAKLAATARRAGL